MLTKTVFLLALAFLSLAEMKRHQNITVIGQISCSGKPVSGVLVELKEKDFLSKDDNLMTTQTDKNGTFVAYGEDNEVMDISPYLIVHHNCTKLPCNAKSIFDVPSTKINGVFDFDVDLSNVKDAEKSC